MSGEYVLGEVGLAQDTELFNQVSDRAVNYARERAGELVSDIDEVTRRDLRNVIAQGLEDNLSMDELSDLIETSYAFSEQRADIIAQTEIARANGNGSLEGMRLAREAGVRIKKVWIPDAEACEECQENGDAGPIDLDENFPNGDDAPPAHPNCRCDMASEVDESDESNYNDDSEE
jgi:SPP1 gp7 family putative phage head morphogenesis protein